MRTVEGDVILEDLVGAEPEQEPEPEPRPGPAPKKKRGAKPVPPPEYEWGKNKSFASKEPPIFPEQNYTGFRDMTPKGLYELIIGVVGQCEGPL